MATRTASPRVTPQRVTSASPPPAKSNKILPLSRSRSNPSGKHSRPSQFHMASQEEVDLVKAEVELLKSRLATAEEQIRQQTNEIAVLTANVARLEATTVKSPTRSASPKKKLQNGSSAVERQVSASAVTNGHSSNIRRSSVTLVPRLNGRANGVPKSATTTNIARNNGPSKPSLEGENGAKNGTADNQKWRPQLSNGNVRNTQKSRPSNARQSTGVVRSREATFDRDSNVLRLFLRGRAVMLPAPVSSSESFEISRPVDAPAETLKLEWAHGFRGKTILLLPTGELVYAVAAVVVLLQPNSRSQRFYAEHTDDVKCIAVHPDRVTMASGQVAGHDKEAGKPHVRIWNSVTLQTLHILGLTNAGHFDRAVSSLAFSRADSGALLAAVDDSNEHVLSVWDWKSGHKLGDTRIATDPLIGMDFNPTANAPAELATWGRFGLIWWTVSPNQVSNLNTTVNVRIARLKQATFDTKDRPRAITCAVYTNDGSLLIAGDSNGGLSWWTKGSTRMGRLLPSAHSNGAVGSLFVSPDGDWLLSAGARDNAIVKWNLRSEQPSQLSKLQLPSGTNIRAMQLSGGSFYFGTSGGSILSTSNFDDATAALVPLIQGHAEEVWGVAVHPSKSIAISVGYDRLLVVWDVNERRCLGVRELPSAGHSVACHPNGTILAVGLRTGEWLAVDVSEEINATAVTTQAAKVLYSDHPAREQIECVTFSPDGHFVAVGSRDQHIYVYSVSTDNSPASFARVSRCSGHSSYITHVDWTTDSKYLRSNSGDYELLFWEASTGRQILFGAINKEQEQLHSNELLDMLREPNSWASNSCTLSFSVAGIWPDGADGTDINCADKGHVKNLVAIGDDFGKVRLFRWPCPTPRSHSFVANGHSSHVTAAVFSADDTRVISGGGRDAAIMQWIVTA